MRTSRPGTRATTGPEAHPFRFTTPTTPRKPRMDKPPTPPPRHVSKSLEDVVLKFIERHNRALWAVIFAIALAVVYGVNRA